MTLSSDWWGAPQSDSLMGLDGRDLEGRTLEMQHRSDDLDVEAERIADRIGAASDVVKDGVGEGTAERGAVTVRVDATHRLTDVRLSAKALQLGSTSRLSEAIMDAYEAACADITQQLGDAAGVDGRFSPLDAFIRAIPEVASVLPEELRHPPKPDETERPSGAFDDTDTDQPEHEEEYGA